MNATLPTRASAEENERETAPPRVRLVTVERVESVGEPRGVYSPQDAARIAQERLARADREHFLVMHLDGAHQVVSCEVVSVGTLNSSLVHPREVFKGAILANAKAIICAHNHPSGSLTPSAQDREVFNTLKAAGKLLDIELLDFLIVSGAGSWAASESWT